MKVRPSELRGRADRLLSAYGGLEGLSRNPPWVVGIVLRTWFTEAEGKLLLEFMFHGLKREARALIQQEMRRGGPRGWSRGE